MEKIRILINIPDYISKTLVTIFGLQIIKFFVADPDPGSVVFLTMDPGWKNSEQGSVINIPDPQHC
jgi:hypothetical protein